MSDTELLTEIRDAICALRDRRDGLGGRVYYGAEGIAQRHLFGSVASPNGDPSEYVDFTNFQSHRETCIAAGPSCARTYVVSLTGREIQRTTLELPLGPLPLDAFSNPPAGLQITPRSQLKFAISAQLHSGTRRFFADAGQSFEIQANRICIDWMGPPSIVEVTDQTRASIPSQEGLLVDALLGASAAAIEAPIGMPSFTFTTHLYVVAGTQGVVTIPPFATDVTIYQSLTLGTSSVAWTQLYGTALELGTIPFLPGRRKSEPEIVLPDATHLQSDVAADGADRWFTLRWTCRP